jgi:amino acid adenylation domain-containing protein
VKVIGNQVAPRFEAPKEVERDLGAFAFSRRNEIQTDFDREGVVLFRGFKKLDASQFAEFARLFCEDLEFEYGDLENEETEAGVYRSTVYPETLPIHLHNEAACSPTVPLMLFFHCEQPPRKGGATRIVDSRRLLGALTEEERSRFEGMQARYIRNHYPHLDSSWQAIYGTGDPREAERRCLESGMEFDWVERDVLQTRFDRSIVSKHPGSGESVLTHQLFLFSPALLDRETHDALSARFDEDQFPRALKTFPGDSMSREEISRFHELTETFAVDIDWEEGDVAILDNLRFAHGRAPFEGGRRLQVAMGKRRHLDSGIRSDSHNVRVPSIAGGPPEIREQGNLADSVRSWAEKTPDAVAIETENRSVTYSELVSGVEENKGRMLEVGIEGGHRVGLCGPVTGSTIESFLALWEIGAVVCPLDTGLPSRRQATMTSAAGVSWLVEDGEIRKVGKGSTEQPVNSDHAVIFFTSGTTGIPKGIVGSRKGISDFLAWQRDQFSVGPGDRIPQLTGFSFDVVLRDIFLALVSGATLCLPPERLNLASPLRWLAQKRVTRIHVVPSLGQSWLAHEGDLPKLKTTFFAGEPLTGRLARRWRERAASTRVINFYGPAETTLARCFCDVTDLEQEGILPIGTPLPGTQIHLVDANDDPVPLGETGEIAIRFPGASHGYLDDFSSFQGSLYRTGDLGRVRREDGLIDILGRIDDQVKIRGVRIQPGEIAAVLSKHEKIHAAHVQLDSDRTQDLTGYLVGAEIDSGEIRTFLEEFLPQVMIPARFVWLDEFPITPNGKIDRRRLPAAPKGTGENKSRLPVSETERSLAGLWSTLLGREIKNAYLSFFEAGGFSLNTAQLAVMIEERWSVRVEIRDLFEAPTIAEQALLIGHAPATGGAPEFCEPEDGERIEATASQHRMWFAEAGEAARSRYNIPGSLRLEGDLEAQFFEEKLSQCLQLHGALFTEFLVEEGRLFQSQGARQSFKLEIEDVSNLETGNAEKKMCAFAEEQLAEPFRISDAIRFRGRLFRISNTKHVFIYVFSHLVFDGWSHRVFVRDLLDLLDGGELHRRPSFLAFANSPGFRSARGEASFKYWEERFVGASPCLELPFKQHPSGKPVFQSGHMTRQVDSSLHSAIRKAALRFGATPFMIHLAALTRLLHEVSGEGDLCVGTPVANRPSSECDDIVGCFINTLAIRSRVSARSTLREHVGRIRESVLEAFEHQSVPINEVVRLANPERASWHAPLFQVLLNLLHEEELQSELSNGLRAERASIVHAETKFFLTAYVHWREDSSTLHFAYHAGLFAEEQISGWMDKYLHLLDLIVSEAEEGEILELSGVSGGPTGKRKLAGAYLPDEPESATEILIADIWKGLLSIEQLQRTDHFFELGGHSLVAMQVMHELSEALGRPLPVHLLEDFPILHALATAIESGESPRLPGIESQEALLISSHQEWIRNFQQENLASPAFLVPRGVRIKGPVDTGVLQRAASCVLERHPMLRTLFPDGIPERRDVDEFELTVISVDKRKFEEDLAEEVRRPIIPDRELPIRLTLFCLSDQEQVLVAVAHHMVADCWSMGLPFQAIADPRSPWSPGIFFRDLFWFYEEFVRGEDAAAEAPPRSYDDYLAWQIRMFAEGEFSRHREYWDSILEGAPRRLALPFDRERSANPLFLGSRVEFTIPSGLYERIRHFSRENQTTPYVVMLKVFCETLEDWSGNSDFLVGTPVPNRTDPNVSDVIGLFSHTLLIRYREGGKTLDALTRQVAEAQRHAAFPVESFYADESGEAGLIQARFVLQQALGTPSMPGGWEVEPIPIDRGISKYDVSIVVAVHGSEIRGWFEYNRLGFDESTVADLSMRYLRNLEKISVASKQEDAPETRDPGSSLGKMSQSTTSG